MKINDEQLIYLKQIVKGHTSREIALLMNDKFNTNYKMSQIQDIKSRYKLKSGIVHRKNSGCFKKGQRPHNHKNIGDEYIDKNCGYTYIKIAEPNEWITKQRYVYEKYFGKIPEGYNVIFLNQNKQDFNISNLKLVSIKNKLICKNANMFSKDPEITKLGLLNTKLIIKTKEKRKEYN